MKKLLFLLSIGALALLQSCVGPGYYSGGHSSGASFGSGVGIIATSHSRWGYNPYYRAYFDRSLGRYYDVHRGRYFTSTPRRFNTPFYPRGYRSGQKVQLHSNLPHVSNRLGNQRGFASNDRFRDQRFDNRNNNRGGNRSGNDFRDQRSSNRNNHDRNPSVSVQNYRNRTDSGSRNSGARFNRSDEAISRDSRGSSYGSRRGSFSNGSNQSRGNSYRGNRSSSQGQSQYRGQSRQRGSSSQSRGSGRRVF